MASGARSTLADVESFLSALFEPGDIIEVRLIWPDRDAGKPPVSRWATCADLLATHGEWMKSMNALGWGVFIGANPRTHIGGRDAASVAVARCLFVDFDGGVTPQEAQEKCVAAGLLPPGVLDSSGHGAHCWWRLAEPMTDLAKWSGAQKSLIALLGTDKAIHDPPRVMRLTGFTNTKPPVAPCELFDCTPRRFALHEFPEPAAQPMLATASGKLPANFRQTSGGTTPYGAAALQREADVLAGTGEGGRNAALNRAAFKVGTLVGGGEVDRSDAEQTLRDAAMRAGLGATEIAGTLGRGIQAGAGHPRTAPAGWVAGRELPDQWSALPEEMLPAIPRDTRAYPAIPAHTDAESGCTAYGSDWILDTTSGGKTTIHNAIKVRVPGKDGKPGTSYMIHVEPARTVAAIRGLTGDWPRMAGGELFVPKTPPRAGELPSPNAVQRLADANSLFAWMRDVAHVHWANKESQDEHGAPLTPIPKSEFFEYLTQHPAMRYEGIELLPHEPLADGCWYVPCQLSDDDGAAIAELVGRFNAATPIDRVLLLAATLTPAAGDLCGKCPAQIITADSGVSAGKTTTADMITAIWGTACTLDPKDKWSDVEAKLVQPDGLAGRVVFVDNIKTRLTGGQIESFITSKTIQGRVLYVGWVRRPNRVVLIGTANTPRLSTDMASRSIISKIGENRHGDNTFVPWLTGRLPSLRPQVVSGCLKILKATAADGVPEIPPEARDRWHAWYSAVLAKAVWAVSGGVPALAALWAANGWECPTVAAIHAELVFRRENSDADTDEADIVADVLEATIRDMHGNPDDGAWIFTHKSLTNILESNEVRFFGDVRTFLGTIRSKGRLSALITSRNRKWSADRKVRTHWAWCHGKPDEALVVRQVDSMPDSKDARRYSLNVSVVFDHRSMGVRVAEADAAPPDDDGIPI